MITDEQIHKITRLRAAGYGYIRVVQVLGVSDNTVEFLAEGTIWKEK